MRYPLLPKFLPLLWILATSGCIFVHDHEPACTDCNPDPDPLPQECYQYFWYSGDGQRLIGDWQVTGQGSGWLEADLIPQDGYWDLVGTWGDNSSTGELWGMAFQGDQGRMELWGYGTLGDRHAAFYGLEGDRINEGEGWFAFSAYDMDAHFIDGELSGSWSGRGESGQLRGVYDDDGVVYAELEGSSLGLWAEAFWWGDNDWLMWEGTASGADQSAWGWIYGEGSPGQGDGSVRTQLYPYVCE